MIQRGKPTVSVRVDMRRVREMSVGQLLAFADDLRLADAPLTARVHFDRDSHLGERLLCTWSDEPPEPPTPPRVVVEGGSLAVPAEFHRRRAAAGLTQQAIADAVGLARSSVTNFEGGNQDVPLSKLQAYAQAVGARLVLAPLDAPVESP